MSAQKLHWTQRPENQERLKLQLQKAAKASVLKNKTKPQPPVKKGTLVDQLKSLSNSAQKRVTDINKLIDSLTEEKRQLERAFQLNIATVNTIKLEE